MNNAAKRRDTKRSYVMYMKKQAKKISKGAWRAKYHRGIASAVADRLKNSGLIMPSLEHIQDVNNYK